MKKDLLLQLIRPFYGTRRFFIMILCFLFLITINYCILGYIGVFSNIVEKIFFELLILVWLLSPLLLSNHILIRLWCTLVLAVATLLNMVTLTTGIIYQVEASETCWELISNSSWSEIKEFAADFPLRTQLFSCFGLLTGIAISSVLLLVMTRKKYEISPVKVRSFSLNIPFLLCFVPFTCIVIFYLFSSPEKLLKKSIATRYGYEYLVFKARLGNLARLNDLKPPYEMLKFNQNSSDLLGVIVIGESAARDHFGCYGYSRNTTPYFSQIKDELMLFDNILSSSPVTPDALKYLFTNAKLSDKSFQPTSSLTQLLHHLNAETYLFSNQGAWSQYNMPMVLMFNRANEIKFFSGSAVNDHFFQYDEVILDDFLRIEKQPMGKSPRFIFLHLYGSHRKFDQRTPPEDILFPATFRDRLTRNNSRAAKELNAYDSSIAYTDKILKTVIEQLKKRNDQPVFLLYFSDHGEVMNASGKDKRSYHCTRREAFEIPFVVWTNEEYRKRFPDMIRNGTGNLHKLAQTDRLFPSLCALLQISWKDFPNTQNLFSTRYIPMDKVYSQKGKSAVFTDRNGNKVVFPKDKK